MEWSRGTRPGPRVRDGKPTPGDQDGVIYLPRGTRPVTGRARRMGPGGTAGGPTACARPARACGADCAVGSGEWAEPPHSPWTLRRRGSKMAIFWPFLAARGSCYGRPTGRPGAPRGVLRGVGRPGAHKAYPRPGRPGRPPGPEWSGGALGDCWPSGPREGAHSDIAAAIDRTRAWSPASLLEGG